MVQWNGTFGLCAKLKLDVFEIALPLEKISPRVSTCAQFGSLYCSKCNVSTLLTLI